ncbi:MAG: hypothetical protein AAB460_02340 [Patescibacteria group bacterium]
MNPDTTKLFEDFRKILREGDEEKAKMFLREHFSSFPEDMQKKIVMAAFAEGMENKLEAQKDLLAFKKALAEE